MKKILFVLLILLFSCDTEKKPIDKLFSQVGKIEIYAYLGRNHWEEIDNTDYYKPSFIKNSRIEFNKKYLRNKITLTKNQKTKLFKALKSSKPLDWQAACYDPRHAIIFYNMKNEILGYIEICFECGNAYSSSNFSTISANSLSQEQLFKEFGITYFDEVIENN